MSENSLPDNLTPLARELLNATDEQYAILNEGREQGLIELAPVSLPEQPLGDNDHMGWPVATKVNDTLVVIHRRIPGHNPWGAGDGDENSSFSLSVVSEDDGKTWTEPHDLRDAMEPSCKNRGGVLPLSHRYKFGPVNESREGYRLHLNAVGTSSEGTVVLLCNYGAFRSADKGRTWTHQHEQFREDTTEGEIVYLGPRIVEGPDSGLYAFGHTVGYGRGGRQPNPVEGPIDQGQHNFVILSSQDDGKTWKKDVHSLPRWAAQHEPAAVYHEGDMFVLSREGRSSTSYLQIRVSDGEPVDLRRANIRHTRLLDTPDIDYNPVTQRFEVVRSFRERLLVDLWSIDPREWESAEWRFEGVLFARRPSEEGKEFYKISDGFHPAGGVIDAKNGVQHIFIYVGHPNGPAGTFRITRTLETSKLAEFLGDS